MEAATEPGNKVFQGLRPDVKAIWEIATGTGLFPNAFTPRSILREDAAANILSLRDEKNWVKGMFGTGDKPAPHYLGRFFRISPSDPKKNALHEMHDLRTRFLKQQGREAAPFRGISKMQKMRDAAMSDDQNKFQDARAAYLADGGTWEGFVASIGKIDPIASRLSDPMEKKFENEFITGEQKHKLEVARDYARELEIKLWSWWMAEEKGTASDKKLATLASTYSAAPPHRNPVEPREHYEERKAQWQEHANHAERLLKASGRTGPELRKLYLEHERDKAKAAGRRFDISDDLARRLGKVHRLQ